jgi:ketosteroid isomerase-like protein
MRRLAAALLSLALAGMLLGAACADGDAGGDEAEVRAAVQAYFDSWNARDLDGLFAAFTDAGLVRTFGSDAGGPEAQRLERVRAGVAFMIGNPPVASAEFGAITVDGDTATVEVRAVGGIVLDEFRYTLVREDGTWKIDREENFAVEIPAGTRMVEAKTREFAFDIDTDALASATKPFALAIENIGAQPHELVMLRGPEGADLSAALSEPGTPDFEFDLVAGVGPIEPDESHSIVFAEALPPGHYVILCALPDITEGPDGTPHLLKGMLAEFTR